MKIHHIAKIHSCWEFAKQFVPSSLLTQSGKNHEHSHANLLKAGSDHRERANTEAKIPPSPDLDFLERGI